MYDIKRIEYYVKHPEEIRISKKWMRQILYCSKEGRKICKGFCCKHIRNGTYVQFKKSEIDKLPKEYHKYFDKDGILKVENNTCPLIEYCVQHPEIRPLDCRLPPLTIDKNGILRIQYGAICGGCPNFKKGDKPVYVTMKEDIIHIFGQEFYDRLVEELI